ncbi:unnamed protein product [Amoebophrya sp. A25]|nr:unnamed protein product [Amoebophrya sp. A25]|eukprot:GSA25T00018052001.1
MDARRTLLTPCHRKAQRRKIGMKTTSNTSSSILIMFLFKSIIFFFTSDVLQLLGHLQDSRNVIMAGVHALPSCDDYMNFLITRPLWSHPAHESTRFAELVLEHETLLRLAREAEKNDVGGTLGRKQKQDDVGISEAAVATSVDSHKNDEQGGPPQQQGVDDPSRLGLDEEHDDRIEVSREILQQIWTFTVQSKVGLLEILPEDVLFVKRMADDRHQSDPCWQVLSSLLDLMMIKLPEYFLLVFRNSIDTVSGGSSSLVTREMVTWFVRFLSMQDQVFIIE